MGHLQVDLLTAGEVGALLRACSSKSATGLRNRALITVMYRAGLRVSEALDLKPADIDPATGVVRVADGKGHKPRTVALDDGAVAVVQLWRNRRAEIGLGRSRFLFCTLDGRPLWHTYVRSMLGRLRAEAGIDKRVHPHALRHAYAVGLSTDGAPTNVIQKALGHDRLQTTAIYLDHIAPADVIAMIRNRPAWTP